MKLVYVYGIGLPGRLVDYWNRNDISSDFWLRYGFSLAHIPGQLDPVGWAGVSAVSDILGPIDASVIVPAFETLTQKPSLQISAAIASARRACENQLRQDNWVRYPLSYSDQRALWSDFAMRPKLFFIVGELLV